MCASSLIWHMVHKPGYSPNRQKKLRKCQAAIERSILRIWKINKVYNTKIREQTKLIDF